MGHQVFGRSFAQGVSGHRTYTNPVYRHTCPDPFVLKFCGEYWCYYTGIQPDNRCFGILHSKDLVNWEYAGSALDPLPEGHTHYWAPEVSYENGLFYLYYSVGNEEKMQIRAATSHVPEGPFLDSGRRLTKEDFAIDAHVFVDDDGQRYMFYAADFLDVPRVGTGTVMDKMIDPLKLEGKPRPVTRALYDWQIYDSQRESKGGMRWHTLEGPFVLKHNRRYYQMFSGGNWQNNTYGVSYATTGSLDQHEEWDQLCNGKEVLPILRSLPEHGVIGPGHNSVVRGPDNQELFCIYHRWQIETEERVMAIDRLEWRNDQLTIIGPTFTPQPAPHMPKVKGFQRFNISQGSSSLETGQVQMQLTGEASLSWHADNFVLEVSLLLASESTVEAGLELQFAGGQTEWIAIRPEGTFSAGGELHTLPDGFNPLVFHLIRLEYEGETFIVHLDGKRYCTASTMGQLEEIRLFGSRATFAGLEVS